MPRACRPAKFRLCATVLAFYENVFHETLRPAGPIQRDRRAAPALRGPSGKIPSPHAFVARRISTVGKRSTAQSLAGAAQSPQQGLRGPPPITNACSDRFHAVARCGRGFLVSVWSALNRLKNAPERLQEETMVETIFLHLRRIMSGFCRFLALRISNPPSG